MLLKIKHKLYIIALLKQEWIQKNIMGFIEQWLQTLYHLKQIFGS